MQPIIVQFIVALAVVVPAVTMQVPSLQPSSTELSEAGYQKVASLRSDDAMKKFVYRLLASEGKMVASEDDLSGLVPWYSGSHAVQTLKGLRKELAQKTWVKPAPETEVIQTSEQINLQRLHSDMAEKEAAVKRDIAEKIVAQKTARDAAIEARQEAAKEAEAQKAALEAAAKKTAEEAEKKRAQEEKVRKAALAEKAEKTAEEKVRAEASKLDKENAPLASEPSSKKTEVQRTHDVTNERILKQEVQVSGEKAKETPVEWKTKAQLAATYGHNTAAEMIVNRIVRKRKNPDSEGNQFAAHWRNSSHPKLMATLALRAAAHATDVGHNYAALVKHPLLVLSSFIKLSASERTTLLEGFNEDEVAVERTNGVTGLKTKQLLTMLPSVQDLDGRTTEELTAMMQAMDVSCFGCDRATVSDQIVGVWMESIKNPNYNLNAYKQLKNAAHHENQENLMRQARQNASQSAVRWARNSASPLVVMSSVMDMTVEERREILKIALRDRSTVVVQLTPSYVSKFSAAKAETMVSVFEELYAKNPTQLHLVLKSQGLSCNGCDKKRLRELIINAFWKETKHTVADDSQKSNTTKATTQPIHAFAAVVDDGQKSNTSKATTQQLHTDADVVDSQKSNTSKATTQPLHAVATAVDDSQKSNTSKATTKPLHAVAAVVDDSQKSNTSKAATQHLNADAAVVDDSHKIDTSNATTPNPINEVQSKRRNWLHDKRVQHNASHMHVAAKFANVEKYAEEQVKAAAKTLVGVEQGVKHAVTEAEEDVADAMGSVAKGASNVVTSAFSKLSGFLGASDPKDDVIEKLPVEVHHASHQNETSTQKKAEHASNSSAVNKVTTEKNSTAVFEEELTKASAQRAHATAAKTAVTTNNSLSANKTDETSGASSEASSMLEHQNMALKLNQNNCTRSFLMTLQPGDLGIGAEWMSGRIFRIIRGTQSALAGVKEGWAFKSINGLPYKELLLDQARVGESSYQVVFEAPCDQEQLNGSPRVAPKQKKKKNYGMKETSVAAAASSMQGKRLVSEITKDCDWGCYLNRYPVLKRKFEGSFVEAERDYVKKGIAVGRNCKCDMNVADAAKTFVDMHVGDTAQTSVAKLANKTAEDFIAEADQESDYDYQLEVKSLFDDMHDYGEAYAAKVASKAEEGSDEDYEAEARLNHANKPESSVYAPKELVEARKQEKQHSDDDDEEDDLETEQVAAQIKDCDWNCYMERYPALKTSLKGNLKMARHHYIRTGLAAGRNCKCNSDEQEREGEQQEHDAVFLKSEDATDDEESQDSSADTKGVADDDESEDANDDNGHAVNMMRRPSITAKVLKEKVKGILPAAKQFLKGPSQVMGKLSQQLEKLKSHLAEAETESHNAVKERKEAFEMSLQNERSNTTALERTNSKLHKELQHLMEGNVRMHARALHLRSYGDALRKQLTSMEGEMSDGEEFAELSQKVSPDHNEKLQILRDLEQQEASKNQEHEHRTALYRMGDFDDSDDLSLSFLQLGEEPKDMDPVGYVKSLAHQFNELDAEEQSSMQEFEQEYQADLEEERSHQAVLLKEQSKLKTKTTAAQLLQEHLRAAVKHLKKTTDALEEKAVSLKQFLIRVGESVP